MDPSGFHSHVAALGSLYHPKLPQAHQHKTRPVPASGPLTAKEGARNEQDGDGKHRIAHTLTACCRCRQRKTRCDATLPRCVPCERSGSTCEYFDTVKGKKINRDFVVGLQKRVRALEAELGQYTEEDQETEDMLRPGGFVTLNETSRYLGPSSGIAMTRILMEEAKRYTDSKRISELVKSTPQARRKKSSHNPVLLSARPAETLPRRDIAESLVLDVFHGKAQLYFPTLHEKKLVQMLEDVYGGSQDPYEQFVINMVLAISMLKLVERYVALADSYYLAAMRHYEAVVRPKDLKTLQCLSLIAQYSLLTPTRSAVYFVIGFATRICQQLGLTDEKTIVIGAGDALTLDMRRRLAWTFTNLEFGLAYSMGRPSGFAKSDDVMDVAFFATVSDEHITEEGIMPGPADEKKLVAIHFCQMRQYQAEIRRVLYETKQQKPGDALHVRSWRPSMEGRIRHWLASTPENPAWCERFFTGRYHAMMMAMHRPSPQVPKPSAISAKICFTSAAFVIMQSHELLESASVDITWVFMLMLYMALNALLWSVTYSEIRASHARQEVEELVDTGLAVLEQCNARWPGTSAAADLYSTLANACLQSYESTETPGRSSPPLPDSHSPPPSDMSGGRPVCNSSLPSFNPPSFSNVFNTAPERVGFEEHGFPSHPTFRSNSIFHNPASNDHTGRRFSYFPPDLTQTADMVMAGDTSLPEADPTLSPPLLSPPNHMPTPSESYPSGSITSMPTPLLSNSSGTTPNMSHQSPGEACVGSGGNHNQHQPPPSFSVTHLQQQQQQQQHEQQQHHHLGQQPLPSPTSNLNDWSQTPPQFFVPYGFGGTGGSFWAPAVHGSGLGLTSAGDAQWNGLQERHCSISYAQQVELMDVLESDGMADIKSYLNMGMSYDNQPTANASQPLNWTGHS